MKISSLITVLLIIQYCTSKYCGINHLKKPKRTLNNDVGDVGRKLLEDKWESIRIHFDFSYIENNRDRMKKQDIIDLKEKIMPKTKKILESLLKVRRVSGKLKLNAPTCETFPIPDYYHSDGVEADLVIFVLLDDSGYFTENSIEAAAIHCLQHQTTLRPVAGYIQFKQDLKVDDSTALDYMTWLALHEITHILVMNSSLYDDFIDPNTLIPLGYDKIIVSSDTGNGKRMNRIKTKKVMEKAKEHFGCDNIEGIPLEYNGGVGTAGSHWSKKYMNTDFMIGDSYGENVISDISLALYEDSGWYKVDYEMSNNFNWGKKKGCNFLDPKMKCVENDKSNYTEFCSNLSLPMCSISNVFRAKCKGVKSDNPFKSSERYFNNPNVAGLDALVDYCPIAIEDKNNQIYYGGSCRQGTEAKGIYHEFEKVCPECACFMSNLSKEKKFLKDDNPQRSLSANIVELEDVPLGIDDKRASCFSYKCKDDSIYIIINESDYKCENGSAKIKGYLGSITCPPYESICNKKFKCKFGCAEKYDNNIPFEQFNK